MPVPVVRLEVLDSHKARKGDFLGTAAFPIRLFRIFVCPEGISGSGMAPSPYLHLFFD